MQLPTTALLEAGGVHIQSDKPPVLPGVLSDGVIGKSSEKHKIQGRAILADA